jgi:flagella synthesis protein FlgN
MTALAALLTRETELVSQFISVLKHEQETLKLGKPDELAAINAEKMLLVEQLNQIGIERSALADMTGTGTDRTTMVAWLEKNPQEKKSAALWVKLLQLAQEAKELHQLNGKLISMHLQHTTDAIAVLTQQHREHSLLYGSDGQASAYTGSRIVDSA